MVTAVSPRLTVLGVVVPSLPKAAENEARTVGRPTTLLRARISTEDPEGIIEATTARPEALPQTWGETYQANLVSLDLNSHSRTIFFKTTIILLQAI